MFEVSETCFKGDKTLTQIIIFVNNFHLYQRS